MEDNPKRGETKYFTHMDDAAFHHCTIEGEERDDDADCKAPDDDYDQGPDAPKRFGNNRKHVTKAEAKIRRKIAKLSKRKNRK